jgi:hypothetical protein
MIFLHRRSTPTISSPLHPAVTCTIHIAAIIRDLTRAQARAVACPSQLSDGPLCVLSHRCCRLPPSHQCTHEPARSHLLPRPANPAAVHPLLVCPRALRLFITWPSGVAPLPQWALQRSSPPFLLPSVYPLRCLPHRTRSISITAAALPSCPRTYRCSLLRPILPQASTPG